MNTFSTIFYAINGTGLGHISRLLNIAREVSTLSDSLSIKAEVSFITTSEGSQIANEYPVFKLPSMQIQKQYASDLKKATADSQYFVANLFGSFRPDAVVLDTKAEGAYGEFPLFKAYCDKRIFVNRRTDNSVNDRSIRKESLDHYHLTLTPDDQSEKDKYPEDIVGKDDHKFTGVIHGFRPEKTLSRGEVRKLFEVNDDQKLIYVSAGGGGDKKAELQIDAILNSLSERNDIKFLVGYGVLYRGRQKYGANIIPYSGGEVREFFNGLDCAICAAGYNTYQELLAANIPSLFYYQPKGMDRQDSRVLEGEQLGWNLGLNDVFNKALLLQRYELLLQSSKSIKETLNNRPFSYGALTAGVEILKVINDAKDDVDINIAELYFSAVCLKMWKSGLHQKFNHKFSKYIRWILIIQPMIIGKTAWEELLEGFFVAYKTNTFFNENIVLKMITDSDRVITTKRSLSGMGEQQFLIRLKRFLKKYSINELNPISLKSLS